MLTMLILTAPKKPTRMALSRLLSGRGGGSSPEEMRDVQDSVLATSPSGPEVRESEEAVTDGGRSGLATRDDGETVAAGAGG